MKLARLMLVLSFAVSIASTVGAQATRPAVPDKQETRRAIDEFLKSPKEAGPQRAKLIMDFAEQSEDVLITPFPELFSSWVKPSEPGDAQTLFTAYVAGNVREQLDRNVNRDESYAGLKAMFDVYRVMQKEKPQLSIPQVDALIKEEDSGKLKGRIDELRVKHNK
jgi:hypothetical protein